MLRRFIHELGLPARLLKEPGGERRLTNLLHLAELLQEASTQLDGEQALIRWFAEQIEGLGEGAGGDERVLRLESDARLVKVVTVHKSKGLEYPLVYLPFAASARKTDRRRRSFFEYVHEDGGRRIDLALSDEALEAVDRARLEEDLRLLYVALTRSRHFLWLGVAAVGSRKKGENQLHESALGYLMSGGAPVPTSAVGEHLGRLRGDCGGIELHTLDALDGCTMLNRVEERPALSGRGALRGRFRTQLVGRFLHLDHAPHDGAADAGGRGNPARGRGSRAGHAHSRTRPGTAFRAARCRATSCTSSSNGSARKVSRPSTTRISTRAWRSASSAPAGATGWTMRSPGCARW